MCHSEKVVSLIPGIFCVGFACSPRRFSLSSLAGRGSSSLHPTTLTKGRSRYWKWMGAGGCMFFQQNVFHHVGRWNEDYWGQLDEFLEWKINSLMMQFVLEVGPISEGLNLTTTSPQQKKKKKWALNFNYQPTDKLKFINNNPLIIWQPAFFLSLLNNFSCINQPSDWDSDGWNNDDPGRHLQ